MENSVDHEKIISREEVMRYLLLLREMEMNSNYKLSGIQKENINEINEKIKNDSKFSKVIELMLNSQNLLEQNLLYKRYLNGEDMSMFDKQLNPIGFDEDISTDGDVIESETNEKVYTKKKAGYVDALTLALITGFAGGVMTTIVLFLCNNI